MYTRGWWGVKDDVVTPVPADTVRSDAAPSPCAPRVQFSGWLFRLTSLPTVLIDAAFCWQRNLACCPFPLKYLILVSTKPVAGQTAIPSLDRSHHFE